MQQKCTTDAQKFNPHTQSMSQNMQPKKNTQTVHNMHTHISPTQRIKNAQRMNKTCNTKQT